MAVSAYKIAVNIMAVNGVSSVVRAIGRDVLGLGRNVDRVSSSFKRWGIIAATASAAISAAIVTAEWKLVRAGDKLIQQRQRLRSMGVTASGAAGAMSIAETVAGSTHGVTPAQVLGLISQARLAVGSTAKAEGAAPGLAKVLAVFQSGGYAKFAHAMPTILKTSDILAGAIHHGHFSAKQLAKTVHAVMEMTVATHGLVAPEQMYRGAQLANIAQAGGKSIRFIAELMAGEMQLGTRFGSGLAQIAEQMIGGQASIKSVWGMQKYGLLKPGGFMDIYGHFQLKPQAVYHFRDLQRKGIITWLTHDVLPKLASEGIHGKTGMITALTQVLGSVRAARSAYAVMANRKIFEKDVVLEMKAVAHGHAYTEIVLKTLVGATKSLSAAVHGLAQTVGAPAVGLAVKNINKITSAVLHFEGLAARNPQKTVAVLKVMGAFAVGLGVFATVLGGALIASVVGTGGVLAALGTGIAAFVGVLVWAFGYLKPVLNFIKNTYHAAVNVGKEVWGSVRFVPRRPTVTDFGIGASDFGLGIVHGVRGTASERKPLVPNGHFHAGGGEAGDVYLDGEKVGQHVTRYQAKGLQTNPSTPVGHNLRRGFLPPGLPMMPSPVS